jgi:hypothetical protein
VALSTAEQEGWAAVLAEVLELGRGTADTQDRVTVLGEATDALLGAGDTFLPEAVGAEAAARKADAGGLFLAQDGTAYAVRDVGMRRDAVGHAVQAGRAVALAMPPPL